MLTPLTFVVDLDAAECANIFRRLPVNVNLLDHVWSVFEARAYRMLRATPTPPANPAITSVRLGDTRWWFTIDSRENRLRTWALDRRSNPTAYPSIKEIMKKG